MTKLTEFLNSPLVNVAAMRGAPKQGDLFGIELECEGLKVEWDGIDNDIVKSWAPHNDGSLRAYKGSPPCEWVFNGPVKIKTSEERVKVLFDYFDKRKSFLHLSNRTSCHVHFNMGDKNAYQLINTFILFTMLEGLLDRYCGEDRTGNLFCLSSRYANRQIDWVMRCCFTDFHFGNWRDNDRYCSLNLAAINKFGTIEFRAMRGLDNREEVLQWLDIINEFCQYACYTMKNPVTVVEQMSVKSPVGFLRDIFSQKNVLALTKGMTPEEVNESIYEGLRLVQMMVYKIGTEFDQVRLRGKDFWASFNDDEKPQLDIDPADVGRRGKKLGAPPAARLGKPLRVPGEDINDYARRVAHWEAGQRERARNEMLRPFREPPILRNEMLRPFREPPILRNEDEEL